MLQYRVKSETDGHERVFREDQLGRLAMTAPVLAVLALRFDSDVLPARVERLDGARVRLTLSRRCRCHEAASLMPTLQR